MADNHVRSLNRTSNMQIIVLVIFFLCLEY